VPNDVPSSRSILFISHRIRNTAPSSAAFHSGPLCAGSAGKSAVASIAGVPLATASARVLKL
jgi:hypothetical protein